MESAEIIALLGEVRARVRARHPEAAPGGAEIPLMDLTALVHARDNALGKVAAIGSVNPRPGGVVNTLVQAWKGLVARVLDWHVREQIVFNQRAVTCIDASLEALTDANRALAEANRRIAQLTARVEAAEKGAGDVGAQMEDTRSHWAAWRQEWERKLAQNEIQFLRSVADLQAGFTYRADLMDANYRDTARGQHADFMAALERGNTDIQRRLWADLEKVKLEYERLIHTELRLIRQRLQPAPQPGPQPGGAPPQAAPHSLDYARFAERFRGSEESVKDGQRLYLERFSGRKEVLDIGCGRGEFLELMRDAGVPARGIDLSEESVAACRAKGLDAEAADLFPYLAGLPEGSLDGIFCSQVVEHLPPERLPEMVRLCASRLARAGVIVFETPNPECLAIFATHFYLDPTHVRPVPAPLLAFYLEENGIGVVRAPRLAPAVESMPSLASLPADFREAFFGGLDYALIGRKL